MSQPSIPNITPIISITKQDTLSLLLSSIAMNELSMSHIINAEAEKIQAFVQYANRTHCVKTKEFIQFNSSVSKLMEDVNMEQWLGLNKLDRIIQLIEDHYVGNKPCRCSSCQEEFVEEYELDGLEDYCEE